MDVLPPDPNQMDGYLVVLKGEPCVAAWKAEAERGSGDASADYWAALRSALPTVVPSHYRGICRNPIDRWWEGEPAAGIRSPNEKARRRIWDLYGPDPTLHWERPPWVDPDLLPTIEIAREILSLADDRVDREIVRVTRNTAGGTPNTVGFDVGYWGSDHFSLISDALVMPRWHGCPLEHLDSLRPWGRALNSDMLFPTAVAAAEYRDWYVAEPWTEDESSPGEFHVIRVDLAA